MRASDNTERVAVRFWGKIDKNGPIVRPEIGPCWLWTGGKQSKGYGSFLLWGAVRLAHRVAWAFAHGGALPPDDRKVCHHCDTPACVHPSHLFLGTSADNMRDMVAKGRQVHHTAKLTASDRAEIRRRSRSGESSVALGRAFGVSRVAAGNVAKGRSWKRDALRTPEAT